MVRDGFMKSDHRNSSRHRVEDHNMLNCLKSNRKKMNAGEIERRKIEQVKVVDLIAERVYKK